MPARPTDAQLRARKPKTLRVRPNPDFARDQYGEPCAALMVEGVVDRFVGARVDFERSKAENRVCFLFDATTDVEVPDTRYYRNALASGELLASPSCEHTRPLARIVADSAEHDAFSADSLARFLGPEVSPPRPAQTSTSRK
jgi:hypothetical protein